MHPGFDLFDLLVQSLDLLLHLPERGAGDRGQFVASVVQDVGQGFPESPDPFGKRDSTLQEKGPRPVGQSGPVVDQSLAGRDQQRQILLFERLDRNRDGLGVPGRLSDGLRVVVVIFLTQGIRLDTMRRNQHRRMPQSLAFLPPPLGSGAGCIFSPMVDSDSRSWWTAILPDGGRQFSP